MYIITHYGFNLGQGFCEVRLVTEDHEVARKSFDAIIEEVEKERKSEYEWGLDDEDDDDFEDFSQFLGMFGDRYIITENKTERRSLENTFYDVYRLEKVEKV